VWAGESGSNGEKERSLSSSSDFLCVSSSVLLIAHTPSFVQIVVLGCVTYTLVFITRTQRYENRPRGSGLHSKRSFDRETFVALLLASLKLFDCSAQYSGNNNFALTEFDFRISRQIDPSLFVSLLGLCW